MTCSSKSQICLEATEAKGRNLGHDPGEPEESGMSKFPDRSTFRWRTLALNCGNIDTNPRRKDVFSVLVFSGNESRNLIEFIKILSNSGEC